MFAYGELDIFLAMLEIRYMLISFAFDMLPTATSAAMRLTRFSPISFCRKAKHIESPQGIYRAAAGGISSDASAAHIDVEPTCETNDGLDVGHKTKRYIFMPKTGVVKPKGIFYRGGK